MLQMEVSWNRLNVTIAYAIGVSELILHVHNSAVAFIMEIVYA